LLRSVPVADLTIYAIGLFKFYNIPERHGERGTMTFFLKEGGERQSREIAR